MTHIFIETGLRQTEKMTSGINAGTHICAQTCNAVVLRCGERIGFVVSIYCEFEGLKEV